VDWLGQGTTPALPLSFNPRVFMSRKIRVIISIHLSLIFISNCSKKTTQPVENITVYAIKDYFPLNIGDKWSWEIGIDSIPEPYRDGDSVLGEPFVDIDGNGVYDDTIDLFQDLNGNGKYDGPNDPWLPGTPYEDINANGQYDPPNGRYDLGEPFCDLDGDSVWNWVNALKIDAEIHPFWKWTYPSARLSYANFFIGPPGSEYSIPLIALMDAFTNDSLGLRWHGHIDWTDSTDYLEQVKPITIAKESTQIGDVLFYADGLVMDDSLHIFTWISTFVGKEDVTTPAGKFTDCLKFKSEASGWIRNMAKWSGTSCQWYAKELGLVKSSGTGPNDYWLLLKATVGGKTYP
jgi:hypothetical protein